MHAFTVDVEDWFDGIPIASDAKAGAERRLRTGMDILTAAMAERSARGTFFFLGPVARDYPKLVRALVDEGHEIGCHGWSHDLIYSMTRERFRSETAAAKAAIEDIAGEPVTTYRAAYFSVTKRSLWALEILAELGFDCDSSVFPISNWRYGIRDFNPAPATIETASGVIREFPLSVVDYLGRRLPAGGGAYFRIYPYVLTRTHVRRLESAGIPTVFYIHPWELDPEHPRVPFHWRARLTHYWNLRSTQGKLQRLLSDFTFGSLKGIARNGLE